MGGRKFRPGDKIIANENAPGDYRGLQGIVIGYGPGASEYTVDLNGQRTYLNSWWLDPAYDIPKTKAEHQQLGLFGQEPPRPKGVTVSEAQHLIALSKISGVGVRTLRALYENHGQFSSVWDLPKDNLISLATKLKLKDPALIVNSIVNDRERLLKSASQDMEAFTRRNIHVLTINDSEFPARLRQMPDPPYWLFVEGNTNTLSSDNLVAVVGTRRPTTAGIHLTRRIVTILAKHGFPVVSGLAEGIDAAAHETALDYGTTCVAILGNGISIVFPRATAGIRQRIVQSNGAIASEYLPYDSYQKARFVQRNRIQAAISRAVIPVEWNEQGGTAHTVRFAHKYGRLVILAGYHSHEEKYRLSNGQNDFAGRRYFIDFASSDAETRLLGLLSNEGVKADTLSASPNNVGNTPFVGLQQEFGRIVEQYPVSEEDIEKLVAEMRRLWFQRKSSHAD